MKIIPVSNHSRQLSGEIKEILKNQNSDFRPLFFYTKKTFREHLMYETPEIVIINFSDSPKTKYELLKEIGKDQWLNSAGIIAIHNEREGEFEQKFKNANIIASLHIDSVVEKLPRIIKIVEKNKSILFQRSMQSMFTGEFSGSFEIDNDLLDVQVHANLLVNFVYNSNFVDEDGKSSLKLVLQELLINAVEHGNCGITFEDKSRVMMEGVHMMELIKERMENDSSIKDKTVRMDYKVNNGQTWVKIIDQGAGFDWKAKFEKKEEPIEDPIELLLHGRGVNLAKDLCQKITYNDKGNQVELFFENNSNFKFIVPGFFESDSETKFKKGEVVFSYGEESNFLYYIASGKYQVLDDSSNVLSELTPNDVFIGEMSFLLYNIRTASVVTIEDGVLYKISKKNFVSAIQKLPYYSLMLCKILAKRLENVNTLLSKK